MVVIDSLKLFLNNLFIFTFCISICDITRIGLKLIIMLLYSCYLISSECDKGKAEQLLCLGSVGDNNQVQGTGTNIFCKSLRTTELSGVY